MKKSKKYIAFNQKTVSELQKHRWGRCEDLIWMDQCVYRTEHASLDRKGIVMLTRGALYIFRTKLFKGNKLRLHYDLVSFQSISQSQEGVLFTYPIKAVPKEKEEDSDNFEETLLEKSEKNMYDGKIGKLILVLNKPGQFFLCIHKLVKRIGYNNPVFKMPEFHPDSTIEIPLPLTSRPKFSLERRAIALAHKDLKWGKRLVADYFREKWDGTHVLRIGNTFHPHYYAGAFGHAVGWESAIDTVAFKGCQFTGMDKFLEEIVKNAIAIKTIAFVDYKMPIETEFHFTGDSGSIKRWHFINCNASVISKFVKRADELATPPEELAIARRAFPAADFAMLSNGIAQSVNLSRVRVFKLVDVRFIEFPYSKFEELLRNMPLLSQLLIRNVTCDGNHVLGSICRSRAFVSFLNLQKLEFREDVGFDETPPGMAVIDISESKFFGNAFFNFLSALTKTKTRDPFILKASKLEMTESEIQALSSFSMLSPASNILEFDLSGQFIAGEACEALFGFLKTQETIEQLVLNDLDSDEPRELCRCISNFVGDAAQLIGIELGVRLPESITNRLLLSLMTKERLQRLCIRDSGAGNAGITMITSLVGHLKNLTEFAGDGFVPTPIDVNTSPHLTADDDYHPLIKLWKAVGKSKTIKRNDFPHNDLFTLRQTLEALPAREQVWVANLKSRPPPSTEAERIEDMVNAIRKREEEEAKAKADAETVASHDTAYDAVAEPELNTIDDFDIEII